ncbi:MAG: pyridoxamine 5'-phosphate oxidase family protein [Burkholderiaceae bacterium]
MSQPQHTAHEATLWDLIKDIKFAMFTTRNGEGRLQARPMTTQNAKLDEDNALWFFMSRSSEPAMDLLAAPDVGVIYADPGKDSWVSVSGQAAVVEDAAKKKKLWNVMTQAWFPKGVDDPDLALVCVRIVSASYWNVKENQVVQLLKMAAAVITGKPPEMGEHADVKM